jgi:Tfp pilus assembly protein PilF
MMIQGNLSMKKRGEKTMEDSSSITEYSIAVENYTRVLDEIDRTEPQQPQVKSLFIEALIARDTVESIMTELNHKVLADISKMELLDDKLEQLDQRFRIKGEIIAETLDLDRWRSRLKPPDESWWWHFQKKNKVTPWDRFDWIWNGITIFFLALSTSFMISIFKSLSVGSMTVSETFTTIAQFFGLAALTRGALTQKGQKKVKEILISFHVPERLRSETTLILSFILFLIVFASHSSLDEHYYNKGMTLFQKGKLSNAESEFLKGLVIEPDNTIFNSALGKVYEAMGDLDKAAHQYSIDAQSGSVMALNDLGRALINRLDTITGETEPVLAESILVLGLQRAQDRDRGTPEDIDLLYQFNCNLGWALLVQKKYKDAEKYLKNVVELEQKITGHPRNEGMAYCFLAQAYTEKKEHDKAHKLWKKCINHARPETIYEYRWFMMVDKDEIASCIDTSRIISGLDGLSDKQKQRCKDIWLMLEIR